MHLYWWSFLGWFDSITDEPFATVEALLDELRRGKKWSRESATTTAPRWICTARPAPRRMKKQCLLALLSNAK